MISSWALVHTVYGLRYAHAFYGDSDEPGVHQHAGGLIFPGDRPPDYFDFAYFSFVVGMTCQVSDVQITSRRMRRITLIHSVLSFGFNTLILALLINIRVGFVIEPRLAYLLETTALRQTLIATGTGVFLSQTR